MRKGFLLTLLAATLFTSSALGASIDGRFGFTGKAGAFVPVKDDFISSTDESKTGLAYGGGVIFGLGRGLALEVDVTHAPNFDVKLGGSKVYEARLTDVAVGLQYRIMQQNDLVPYLGLGADFIKGSLKQAVSQAEYSLDWTEGGHANLGLDYFITRGIAFNIEGRYVVAFDGDVKSGGTKVGTYKPMSFIGTLGFRFLLPESAFW